VQGRASANKEDCAGRSRAKEGELERTTHLLLLRPCPISPSKLASPCTVSTEVLCSDLRRNEGRSARLMARKRRTDTHLGASVRPQILAPLALDLKPPSIPRMDQLMRQSIFHVSLAHEPILAEQDAEGRRVASGEGWRAGFAGDGKGEVWSGRFGSGDGLGWWWEEGNVL
jgi:hypothetical protein